MYLSLQKTSLRKYKDSPQKSRKYLESVVLIKDLCPKCIINSTTQPSPLNDRQSNKKWTQIFE